MKLAERMMRLTGGLAFSLTLLHAAVCTAQLPQARLQAIFPCGGQRGTTVEVNQISGTDLDKATELRFSNFGFSAELKTQMVDGLPQPVYGNWRVKIHPAVMPGIYDVRVGGALGLSNPRSFIVGDLPEIKETEPNNRRDKANALQLNQTVNGRMEAAADLDWYKFTGKQGERIVLECWAHRLDSRMSPVVELYHGQRRLAVAHNESHGEPLMDVVLPADGEYHVKVFDFVYASGPEYFYRLSVHTRPHVDFIVPASGLPDSTGEYTLYGRNLPGGTPSPFKLHGALLQQVKVPIVVKSDPTRLFTGEPAMSAAAGTDAFSFVWQSPVGLASPVTVPFAAAPTAAELEPNNEPAQSQKITLPIEITGRFQNVSDVDRFEFEARKGEVYWIEVFAERDGSIADPYLIVERVRRDKQKKESVQRITLQDDNNQNIGANFFDTASDDPQFRLAISEDATYRVVLADRYADSRGDPLLQYRLCIRKEQPDFRLVAMTTVPVQDQGQALNPWELGLRRGDHAILQVLAFRRDGMNEPIEVKVAGLPLGVTCAGSVIAPGQSQTTLLFTASEKAEKWSGGIGIYGKAAGKTRQARGGTILFNNGQGRRKRSVARVMREVVLSVQDEAAPYEINSELRELTVNQGQQILVPVRLIKRYGIDADIPLQFVNPPPNVQVENKPIKKGTTNETLKLFVPNNTPAGRYLFQLRAAAPVNYRYHLPALEAATKVKAAADKVATEATATARKVTEARNAAEKKSKEAREAFPKAEEAYKQAELAFQATDQKGKAAHDELAQAEGKFKEAEALAELARVDQLRAEAEMRQVAEQLEKSKSEVASLKAASQKSPENKKFLEAIAVAEKEQQQTLQNLEKTKATHAKTAQPLKQKMAEAEPLKAAFEAAQKKFEAMREPLNQTGQKRAMARDALELAAHNREVATREREAIEKPFQDATAQQKEAEKNKAIADRRFNEANAAARSQQFPTYFPVTAIDLTVKPALATLQSKLSGSASVKRGAAVSVPVKVSRQNGFKGPLVLSLMPAPFSTGLSAIPVSIPADKNEGTLVIQATPQATLGPVAYLVLRAAGEVQGPAAADLPLTLSILP